MVLVFVSSFYISLLLPRGYGFLLFTSNLSDTCPSFLASRVDELLVFFFRVGEMAGYTHVRDIKREYMNILPNIYPCLC